jgi:hypothetical protein
MSVRIRRLYLLTALISSFAVCVHVVLSPSFGWRNEDMRFFNLLIGLLIVAWLISDPKLPKHERPTFDHGFMHLAFFPLIAAYEQYRIRRWKGLAIVLGLLLMWLAPGILGAAANRG